MIIGITLIVDELHKGHRLVYRYPTQCPTSLLGIKLLWDHFYRQFSSIDAEQFSKLFCPKPAMNNALFELAIDDIEYISYPMPCFDELNGGFGGSGGVGEGDGRGGEVDPVESEGGAGLESGVGAGGLGGIEERGSGGRHLSRKEDKSRSDDKERSVFNGFAEDGSVGDHGDALNTATDYGSDNDQAQRSNVIRRFNLVIAKVRDSAVTLADKYDVSAEHKSGLGSSGSSFDRPMPSSAVLCRVVETLSRAMLREERRDRYISSEVKLILSLLGNSETSDIISNSHLREEVLLRSGLANEIRVAYLALIMNDHLRMHVNRTIHIDLQLGTTPANSFSKVQPYHTLLVVADMDEWCDGTEHHDAAAGISNPNPNPNTNPNPNPSPLSLASASARDMALPGVHKLLRNANPTKTLEQIALELELPFGDLLALVQHAVFWRAGRVINTITTETVFQVSPEAVLYGNIVVEFQNDFPHLCCTEPEHHQHHSASPSRGFGFHGVLALLDGDTPFGRVVQCIPEHSRPYAVDAVVWLLRKGVIRDIAVFLVQVRPLPTIDWSSALAVALGPMGGGERSDLHTRVESLLKRFAVDLRVGVCLQYILHANILSRAEAELVVRVSKGALIWHRRYSGLFA